MRAAALALLLAGCATSQAPRSEWLVGRWLRVGQGAHYPEHCDTGLPIYFAADGTWRVFEGDGTWRLDGNRLTQVTIDTVADEVPPPSTSRLVPAGPDAFRLIAADGTVATLRRCPDEP